MYSYTCKNCSISFSHHKKNKKFCNQKCYFKSKSNIVTKTCIECNTEFAVPFRHREKKFCNQKCMGNFYSKTMSVEKITLTCKNCENDFKVKPYREKAQFCSLDCKHQDLRNSLPEIITKICEECNKEFKVKYTRKKQRFCNRSCSTINDNPAKRPEVAAKISKSITERILSGNFKPYTHYKTGHFVSIKSNKQMYYRSSYELIALENLEADESVCEFDTEIISIPYEHNNRTHNYIPDIWVKKSNGEVFLIEVKMKWALDDEFVSAKAQAANKFCSNLSWKYLILTEDDLIKNQTISCWE